MEQERALWHESVALIVATGLELAVSLLLYIWEPVRFGPARTHVVTHLAIEWRPSPRLSNSFNLFQATFN